MNRYIPIFTLILFVSSCTHEFIPTEHLSGSEQESSNGTLPPDNPTLDSLAQAQIDSLIQVQETTKNQELNTTAFQHIVATNSSGGCTKGSCPGGGGKVIDGEFVPPSVLYDYFREEYDNYFVGSVSNITSSRYKFNDLDQTPTFTDSLISTSEFGYNSSRLSTKAIYTASDSIHLPFDAPLTYTNLAYPQAYRPKEGLRYGDNISILYGYDINGVLNKITYNGEEILLRYSKLADTTWTTASYLKVMKFPTLSLTDISSLGNAPLMIVNELTGLHLKQYYYLQGTHLFNGVSLTNPLLAQYIFDANINPYRTYFYDLTLLGGIQFSYLYTVDGKNQLAQSIQKEGGTELERIDYQYDQNGRLINVKQVNPSHSTTPPLNLSTYEHQITYRSGTNDVVSMIIKYPDSPTTQGWLYEYTAPLDANKNWTQRIVHYSPNVHSLTETLIPVYKEIRTITY